MKYIRFNFLKVLFLGVLMSGCAKNLDVELPGFSYLDQQIALDVAEIEIVDETSVDAKSLYNKMVPSSMAPALKEWAERRFRSNGAQGKATIRIQTAKTFEQGLLDEKDIHVLLNSAPPAHFGAKVHVTIDVKGTPAYSRGTADAALERKIEVASDVKLAFRKRLWQQFSQNFMNTFDDQMVANIKTYLPHLLEEAIA
jgi:hypothetical protein